MEMTETADRPDSYHVTADELRQFIERYERLEAEKKDIAEEEAILEMYKEALGMR